MAKTGNPEQDSVKAALTINPKQSIFQGQTTPSGPYAVRNLGNWIVAQTKRVIMQIIIDMDMEGIASPPTHTSIFEAILQECSYLEPNCQLTPALQPSSCPHYPLGNDPDSSLPWLAFEPIEGPLDQTLGTRDSALELGRVAWLREQQQNKLAQLMRTDWVRGPKRGCDQKQNLSLSPRKTKRIDKSKSYRLIPE